MIDGSPTDGTFVDRVIDISECDRVPTVLIDEFLVLIYDVPVSVKIGVPVGSEGCVVAEDRSTVIDYCSWFSSFDCAASEVNKLFVDVEEMVVRVVGKVVGPSPCLE